MNTTNGNVFKVLVGILAGFITAIALELVTVGRYVPTRDDVSKMIAVQSPYVAERGALIERLDSINKRLARIEKRLYDLE